jgi:hypothetical protein
MPDAPHPDVPDYDLLKTPDEQSGMTAQAPLRRRGIVAAVVLLAAAVAAAIYVAFGRWQDPSRTDRVTAQPEQAEALPPAQPLGGEPEAIAVPPLDETDPLVRELVKRLSSHPHLAAWLTTDHLLRNVTLVVSNVAEGRTPAGQLRVLRPASPFRVMARGRTTQIDPRSYARYDTLAAAAASIDPDGAARLYATLKPRIEEAYRDLGYLNAPFDRALERAIVQLLGTPVVDEAIAVEPRGIGYDFVDPMVEGLPAAQKQLLRMGPENVRIVQSALRKLAAALGIPAERLPPPDPPVS